MQIIERWSSWKITNVAEQVHNNFSQKYERNLDQGPALLELGYPLSPSAGLFPSYIIPYVKGKATRMSDLVLYILSIIIDIPDAYNLKQSNKELSDLYFVSTDRNNKWHMFRQG